MIEAAALTRTWTYFEGQWHEGNVPIMGPRTHAAWLCSLVFDGARSFEGVAPDLDLHCARVNESARKMYLKPVVDPETWVRLAREGIAHFSGETALYIRPMYWAEKEGPSVQGHDPESTAYCMCVYEAPMRAPKGFSVTLSPFRRPSLETMPTDAKAGCLYPNNSRALFEAKSRGFDNAILCDLLGNVAEFATSNIFMVKKDKVYTPYPNGTFLAGITRRRVMALLRADGIEVIETTLKYHDFEEADEIFSTGNYSKVMPATRLDQRAFTPGPIYTRARELYWQFAHAGAERKESTHA